MAGARFGRSVKPRAPLSFCWKVSLVVLLGLTFVIVWSIFSSPSSSISTGRESFDKIQRNPSTPNHSIASVTPPPATAKPSSSRTESESSLQKEEKKEVAVAGQKPDSKENPDEAHAEGEEEIEIDVEDGVDVNPEEETQLSEGDTSGEENESNNNGKKSKKNNLGPLFDPKVGYEWKLCGGRIKQNYMPCIDMEGAGGRRHHERSCPNTAVTCLVPLPKGYSASVPWSESKSKVLFRNVAHPKLSAFVKTKNWVNMSGEYLVFPSEESEFKGGVQHYLDSIEEMVPDIEWGKNIRILLDIGCSSASFVGTLLEKDVLTLSLGLMSDQIDLAQVLLERGIPAVVGNLGTRRLPFPSGIFDAIHCSGCSIHWHSNGGRLLLEMNRILRPGGYFIMSSTHGDAESEVGFHHLLSGEERKMMGGALIVGSSFTSPLQR